MENKTEIKTITINEPESLATIPMDNNTPVNEQESILLESEIIKSINNSLEDNLATLVIKTDNESTENVDNTIAQNNSKNLEQFKTQETIKVADEKDIKMYDFIEEELVNETEEVVNAMPSAPIMHKALEIVQQIDLAETVEEYNLHIQSLPLEDVIRIFGEKEVMEVKAISQMEEAHVEAGPDCGAEHPLVDLLHTFR